jgi:hypothetical protein
LVIVLKGERMKEEEEEEIHHFSLKIGSPFFREEKIPQSWFNEKSILLYTFILNIVLKPSEFTSYFN